jgi:hypothetical protein
MLITAVIRCLRTGVAPLRGKISRKIPAIEPMVSSVA